MTLPPSGNVCIYMVHGQVILSMPNSYCQLLLCQDRPLSKAEPLASRWWVKLISSVLRRPLLWSSS